MSRDSKLPKYGRKGSVSPYRVDRTGWRFGRLRVVSYFGAFNKWSWWWCECDCGRWRAMPTHNLIPGKRGSAHSCGRCLGERHGLTRTGEDAIRRHMLRRCHDPEHHAYRNYGGRGIYVCDRWRFGDGRKTGVQCFIADMGKRPSKEFSIEREDVNGPYEPGNCKWIPRRDQSRNRRSSRFITALGKTMILADWIRETGLCEGTIRRRIKQGLTMDEVMSAPPWFKGRGGPYHLWKDPSARKSGKMRQHRATGLESHGPEGDAEAA